MSSYDRFTYQDAEARYATDAMYRALVDTMIGTMTSLKLTPGEVRDAAMLAAVKFETARAPASERKGHFADCPCPACAYDRKRA